ncbi:MAG: type IV pilus modification protein PilV [Gammaproteobacteria bacterium]
MNSFSGSASGHLPGMRSERGFTLLEALVALLVLAVGLLGLAGLQIQGLRFNTDAYVRSQATMLAYDIMERMRMRRFNTPNDATGVQAMTDYTDEDPGGACDLTSAATADELTCWHDQVRTNLPGGTGTIVRTADGGTAGDPRDDTFQVRLTWTDRSAVDEDDDTVSQIWTFRP